MRGKMVGWTVLGLLIAAFILVPFAVLGTRIEGWTAATVGPGIGSTVPLELLVAGLLASDVVLPVPSSIVSTAAGYLFGVALGTAVSFAGMTAACIVGYGIGAAWGRAAAARLVGAAALEAMADHAERYGAWGVAAGRPVPVLAEASVLLAGVARMPFRRFLAVCSLSNLGISLVYAAAGAASATAGSFVVALAAALVLPALASRLLRPRAPGPAPRPSAPPK